MAADAQSLLGQARCYQCHAANPYGLDLIELGLLKQWADGGATVPMIDWTPDSVHCEWIDKNGDQNGTKAYFQGKVDLASLTWFDQSAGGVAHTLINLASAPNMDELTIKLAGGPLDLSGNLKLITVDLASDPVQGGLIGDVNTSVLPLLSNFLLWDSNASGPVVIRGVSAGQGVSLVNCPSLTSVTFPNGFNNTDITASGCPGITSIPLSAATAINSLNLTGGTGLTTLDLSHVTAWRAGFILDGCTNLASISVNAAATVADAGGSAVISAIGCKLDQTNVDACLQLAVNALLGVGDLVDLSGGTNSAPSAGGAANVAILNGRGVTVSTN